MSTKPSRGHSICTTEALDIKGTTRKNIKARGRSLCQSDPGKLLGPPIMLTLVRQLISMHAMVYGLLTQPYTHMWCMTSDTPWHAY